MIPLEQFLNKIKFSGEFKLEEITLYYKDRFKPKLMPLKFNESKKDNGVFIINNKVVPLHRIKEVRSSGTVIWKR